MVPNQDTLDFFRNRQFGATWGRIIYCFFLPIPTLILFCLSFRMKESLRVRFALIIFYLLESLVVMVTPILYARSVIVDRNY